MSLFTRPPQAHAGTLLHLSLVHCPHASDVPPPPDNRERYRAFRSTWLPPIRNTLTDDGRALTNAAAQQPAFNGA